jgi:7-carboxy-7-deazaguanine synthase
MKDEYTVDQALEEVRRYQCPLVETLAVNRSAEGGLSFHGSMVGAGFTVLLETSGSVDISNVNPAVIKIMDLKCPSSGECDRNVYANLDRLRPAR